jgi:hypothetical protein
MIEIVIFFVVTICDACRDRWFGRVGWWQWHAVKWVTFYLPLVWIAWHVEFNRLLLIPIAMLCLFVWREIYYR